MPPFDKAPPELVATFGELCALVPDATRKLMFGNPIAVVNGHMFMGMHHHGLFLRLPGADGDAFLALEGAQVFEPMDGRAMRPYVVAPPGLLGTPELEDWVARAYEAAAALPPKEPKARKRRPTRP